jgi:hypothetical protein
VARLLQKRCAAERRLEDRAFLSAEVMLRLDHLKCPAQVSIVVRHSNEVRLEDGGFQAKHLEAWLSSIAQ